MCDVYLSAGQRDGFSRDSCSLSSVEQHNARGQEAHGQMSLIIKLHWS